MEAFAVVPLNWCPHLETVAEVPPEGLSVETPCAECDQVGENWVCLICYQVNSNIFSSCTQEYSYWSFRSAGHVQSLCRRTHGDTWPDLGTQLSSELL